MPCKSKIKSTTRPGLECDLKPKPRIHSNRKPTADDVLAALFYMPDLAFKTRLTNLVVTYGLREVEQALRRVRAKIEAIV